MRNKLLFFSLLALLLTTANLQAQKKNPFNAKVSRQALVNTPVTLPRLNTPTIRAQAARPAAQPSYHTIPFAPPNTQNRQYYHNLKFNQKGKLIFLQGIQPTDETFSKDKKESIEKAAWAYLSNIKGMIQIQKPEQEFKALESHTDRYGITHVKLQQYYKGIKVYGGQVFVHGKAGKMERFNGEYFPTPEAAGNTPAISESQALQQVKDHLKNHLGIPFTPPQKESTLLPYKPVVSELVFYQRHLNGRQPKLTWHLTVRPNLLARYEYFVDAQTGKVINYYNNTCSDGPAKTTAKDLKGIAQNINTYLVNGTYFLIDASRTMYNANESKMPDGGVGVIWTIDANNSAANKDMKVYQFSSADNTWAGHPEAVSAHYNAGKTYEYYKNTHGRNSINGKGGTIISICNIANADGSSMENAFWNGRAMFYGNGGSIFSPLAAALDVGAHEMGHGVIQNTCNLEYQDESGALNESMADISGTMVDRADWFLGEDVVIDKTHYPTGHLRDMSNPHNGGTSLNDACYQPAHVSEKYTGSADNGGVHTNSGIMNFAYYKFATAIGKDKAEKIWYKSMTDYLVKRSQFADARVAFVQAATDIYGENSNEVKAVKQAFTEVGIGDGGGTGSNGGTPGEGNLPENPGQDYILSMNIDPNDANTLYLSTTDGTQQKAISQTVLSQKPSVTDDGSFAVFVTDDNKIKYMDLNALKEDYLTDDAVFRNISISKDGKRIAVVTTSVDSAIWVYDFGKQKWAKYHLFNPTFSSGVVTENVLYADALEWDYSGQYIIYDAYNQMKNSSGDNIDYWDMGIIRVWNNAANTWGDGKIEKVFSSLPEGVSIGNPSLSKNSPYIIAFDYFDAKNNKVAVMAANMATGDVGVIFSNVVLGYPNYSKKDDKIIFNAQDNNNNNIIGQIGIDASKIKPAGDASVLMTEKTWGVWFATGSRVIDAVKEQKPLKFSLYPNPATNTLNLLLAERMDDNRGHIIIYNLLGQTVLEKPAPQNQLLYHIDISPLPKGTYFIRCVNGTKSWGKKFIKM